MFDTYFNFFYKLIVCLKNISYYLLRELNCFHKPLKPVFIKKIFPIIFPLIKNELQYSSFADTDWLHFNIGQSHHLGIRFNLL
jgi:hypothetical protein